MFSIIIFCIISYFGWNYYRETAFKRAYEHGTMYEQLDTLMNTKRYAKKVEKAGYPVDQYYLKMNDRIVELFTKSEPKIDVEAPMSKSVVISFTTKRYIHVRIWCNRNMKIQSFLSKQEDEEGKTVKYLELPKSEQQKYLKMAKKEIRNMLKDIYGAIYKK